MYEGDGGNSMNGFLICFVQMTMLINLKNEFIDTYFYLFLLYYKYINYLLIVQNWFCSILIQITNQI